MDQSFFRELLAWARELEAAPLKLKNYADPSAIKAELDRQVSSLSALVDRISYTTLIEALDNLGADIGTDQVDKGLVKQIESVTKQKFTQFCNFAAALLRANRDQFERKEVQDATSTPA